MKVPENNFKILFLLIIFIFSLLGAHPLTADHFQHLDGSPKLRSASVMVMDENGRVIFGKDTDTIRPIASITKLMTAMVVIDTGLELRQDITITREDRDLVQLTGSRLEIGATLSREELLIIAIMSSENRAANALGRTAPGGLDEFIAAMNRKAGELGLSATHFADPAGLRVENRSTAADLVGLLRAAYEYPLVREASITQRYEVRPYVNRGPLIYGNTNRLLKNPSWQIGLSKTGYLNESGRCLVMQAQIDGEALFIVLLDSFGKLTPFGDSNRLRKWMVSGP